MTVSRMQPLTDQGLLWRPEWVLVNAGAVAGVNVAPVARQREDKTMLRPVRPRRRLGWPGDLVSSLRGWGSSSP